MKAPAFHPPNRLTALRFAEPQAEGLRNASWVLRRTPFASQSFWKSIPDHAFAANLCADSGRTVPVSNAPSPTLAGRIPIARQML
jgi:hypothetical protein